MHIKPKCNLQMQTCTLYPYILIFICFMLKTNIRQCIYYRGQCMGRWKLKPGNTKETIQSIYLKTVILQQANNTDNIYYCILEMCAIFTVTGEETSAVAPRSYLSLSERQKIYTWLRRTNAHTQSWGMTILLQHIYIQEDRLRWYNNSDTWVREYPQLEWVVSKYKQIVFDLKAQISEAEFLRGRRTSVFLSI